MTVRVAPTPPGWAVTTLGSVTQSGVPSRGPGRRDGFAYVDIGSINNKTKRITQPKFLSALAAPSRAKQNLRADDVLVSMTRPNLNAVAIVPRELDHSIGSTGFHVLRSRGVEPRWLFYVVQTSEFVTAMSRLVQGALYPAVRPKDITGYSVLLPPLQTQRSIVDGLDRYFTQLDAAVVALDRVEEGVERYRERILQTACEGNLVPTEAQFATNESRPYETADDLLKHLLENRRSRWIGPGKYKEPFAPSPDLPRLPQGWCWSTIDQLSYVVRGASPRPAGDPRYFGGSIPWITVGPITADQSVYLRSLPDTLTEAGRERSRYVEPETLLLTNSGATLGVPKITLIGGCINDGVAALLDVSYPLKLYLVYFLRTQTRRLRAVKQGAAQPNLNTTIIKQINVPLPPLAEQERIVKELEKRLSGLEKVEAATTGNLQRSDRLRQSILQHALEGNLVEESHVTESADILLARIESTPVFTDVDETISEEETMRPKVVATFEEFFEVLEQLGGSASPEKLLLSTGLEANIELFFDLLREGRNQKKLQVPVGVDAAIRVPDNAN